MSDNTYIENPDGTLTLEITGKPYTFTKPTGKAARNLRVITGGPSPAKANLSHKARNARLPGSHMNSHVHRWILGLTYDEMLADKLGVDRFDVAAATVYGHFYDREDEARRMWDVNNGGTIPQELYG